MDGKPLKKFVPENAAVKGSSDNPACPVNGRDVFRALSPQSVIVMAGKDIKFDTKQFKREIDSIPAGYAGGIEDAAYREARELLLAFRAGNPARIVADSLTARV
jgi:hypothetical protein